MKTLILLFVLAIPSISQAMDIQVAPRMFNSNQQEVIGVQLGGPGQAAVIVTGTIADDLAKAVGQAFDAATQMLILTGDEVMALVENSIQAAAGMGEWIVVQGAGFTNAALELTRHAIDAGAYTFRAISSGVTNATRAILSGLMDISSHAVILIQDGVVTALAVGAFAVEAGLYLTCELFWLLGLVPAC